LLRPLAEPFKWLLALIILFEEWGCEPLQRFMAWLARYPVVGALELRIVTLPPLSALLVFLVPTVVLLPVNLFAVWLTAHGQALAGTTLIVALKLLATTLVARIFTLTQPALMTLPWFARAYRQWKAWEAALLEPVRASWAWRAGQAFARRVKDGWSRHPLRRWWRNRRG
jgi:hypothetical protein